MNTRDLAEKIRRRIFDQAEADGRVMHADSMDSVIAEVLDQAMRQQPAYAYSLLSGGPVDTLTIAPSPLVYIAYELGEGDKATNVAVARPYPDEWR